MHMGINKREASGILAAIILMFIMGILTVLFTNWLTGGTDDKTMTQGVMTSSEVKKNEVTVWYYNDEFTPFLDAANVIYEKECGIKLNCIKVKEENYLELVNEHNISGIDIPDIYIMNSSMLEKAVLAGLTEENTNDDIFNNNVYSDTAISAVTYKGRKQAYPLNFDTSFMVYNTAYTQNPPATFDDIINFSNSVDETISGLVENILLWDVKGLMYNYGFAGGYLEYGGKNGDDVSVKSFTNDKLIKSMAYYHNLNQIFSIDINSETYDDVITRFSQGKVVYAILKTDGIKRLEEAEGQVGYNTVVLPDLNSELTTRTLSVTNVAVVNPYADNGDKAENAAEFLSYDMANIMYESTGKLSAKKDIEYENSHLNVILNQYDKSVNLPKLMEAGDFGAKLESVLNQIWQGADIQQSLSSLER
ncbi:MAG: hypothetical protein K2M78_06935 [Lachnospiraceae bacterium]|nr:hypothetical protein [Lachnospiraceae bacterium]